jgi:hypothetical protein
VSQFITDKLTQPQRDVVTVCMQALDASGPPAGFLPDEQRRIAEIAVWRHGSKSTLHQMAAASRALLERCCGYDRHHPTTQNGTS